jgi:hypothetical protein
MMELQSPNQEILMENQAMEMIGVGSNPIWRSPWFRSLGWLPLVLFVARLIEYIQVGTPSQVLWMCHLANLLLAAGLFLANPLIIRAAVILLIFGIPPWIVDMFVIRIVTPVSVASHLGGLIVGLLAVSKVRAKPWAWPAALACFVFVQIICRFLTPPALNVNTSHRVYDIWKGLISNYWVYWLISTAILAVSLWVIDLLLAKFFPPASSE